MLRQLIFPRFHLFLLPVLGAGLFWGPVCRADDAEKANKKAAAASAEGESSQEAHKELFTGRGAAFGGRPEEKRHHRV